MGDQSAAATRRASLLGRAEECALLDAFIGNVRQGRSQSLVLRGEAGIGKTALLDYLSDSAADMWVLKTVGVESDMELAYASLHQLCAPRLDRIERLPLPQREALATVFGLSTGAPPDRFLVELAALSLLSDVAEELPLLCVIDDAQWLDKASSQALAFVARRLLAESVGIVFAAREAREELQHVSGVEVRGLRNGDARSLLRSAVRFKLDDQVGDRIIAEARGNPLALLELPRHLTATELAGGFGAVEERDLSGQVEESFVRRLAPLPEDTRLLLLVAAAEPLGDPVLVWRAAERLGIAATAYDAAEAKALLTIGARVTFRHPLVRSAVYRAASVEDRRAVHSALAEATDPVTAPDRRAWHLAEATSGPDEHVAAELERSAGRAQSRAGVAAAAAFLTRSVALTLEPGPRAQRALAAAQAHLQAGVFDDALRLVASADDPSLDEFGRAQRHLLQGQIAFASGEVGEAPRLLLQAAREFEGLDTALAREIYLDAWGAANFAGGLGGAATLPEVSRAAIAAPQPATAPGARDLLLEGLALLMTEGRAAAASTLGRAVSAFAKGEIAPAEGFRWGFLAASAAFTLWDDESWHSILARQLATARDAGMLANLPIYLNALGASAAWRGDFAVAASLIAEADGIADATGTRLSRYAAMILACSRGREGEASALIESELRNASAAGQGLGIQTCQWVSAVLHNGLARYEKALTDAQRASDQSPQLSVSAFALPELIEAAARTGQTRLARDALERLAEAASVGERDWGLGLLARSRALLSEGEDAEGSYLEALARLQRTNLRPQLARGHLLYGEWLRRENRRVDARFQLRTAYEEFMAIGMEAFAERARTELRATGEKVRARTPEARYVLTPQERQIAELARDGFSNPEIGVRLFLSPRTVEWHLAKVFTKLDIRARRELANALATSRSQLVSA